VPSSGEFDLTRSPRIDDRRGRKGIGTPSEHDFGDSRGFPAASLVRNENMRLDQRVVTTIPLTELWDSAGPIAARRGLRVGDPKIRALLQRTGPVQFVVADAIGRPLRWVPLEEARTFWRFEVRPRIVPADAVRFDCESYPGRYCYVATEWVREAPDSQPLVLFERYH
jgi:hypothetical protein